MRFFFICCSDKNTAYKTSSSTKQNGLKSSCQRSWFISQAFAATLWQCVAVCIQSESACLLLLLNVLVIKLCVFLLLLPQMLQACSMQHLPVPYPFPSLLSSDPQFLLPHPPHLSPHPPHLPTPGQFIPFQTQQPRSVSVRWVCVSGVF